jgi:hypothetical protein
MTASVRVSKLPSIQPLRVTFTRETYFDPSLTISVRGRQHLAISSRSALWWASRGATEGVASLVAMMVSVVMVFSFLCVENLLFGAASQNAAIRRVQSAEKDRRQAK